MSNLSVGAHELKLYTENDGALHRQVGQSILKNLAGKKASGAYKHDLGVKAFGYLADAGAKKYAREHGGGTAEWFKMFPPADRKQVAEEFAKEFEVEYALGNYSHLVPKKYQEKAPKHRRRA